MFLFQLLSLELSNFSRTLEKELSVKRNRRKKLKQTEENLQRDKKFIEDEIEKEREKLTKFQDDLRAKKDILEQKLSQLQEDFEKSFQKFEANWKNWETQDIVEWIQCLDDHE